MRAAYLVSRFPHVSETFIIRELNAVDADSPLDLDLYALFGAVEETVHPAAEPWVRRVRRPGILEGLAALGWWSLRRPVRLLGAFAAVIGGYARSPRVLVRALAALPIAARHARRVADTGVLHVHAHFATYPALAAWLCKRLTGVSYSFTAHAHDIFVHQLFLTRKLDEARFVVAISEFNRDFLEAHAEGGATPIEVIHCGVDPSAYPFKPRVVPASGPIRGICVAGLRESKGHRVLFDAIAGQSGELARLDLDLVGGGPLDEELRRLAAALGIEARVTFHGSLTEPDVARLLDSADLFVLPSVVARNGDMEGIPVALMEAMASGLPVVASRMSGIPELVRDGETGVLCEPGDVESLRRGLRRVIGGRSQVSLVAARTLVEEAFNLDRSAARLAELILEAGSAEPLVGG